MKRIFLVLSLMFSVAMATSCGNKNCKEGDKKECCAKENDKECTKKCDENCEKPCCKDKKETKVDTAQVK